MSAYEFKLLDEVKTSLRDYYTEDEYILSRKANSSSKAEGISLTLDSWLELN